MTQQTNLYAVPYLHEFEMTQEEIDAEVINGMRAMDEQMKEEAVLYMFDRKFINKEFINLPWYVFGFYWLKAFLCAGFRIYRYDRFFADEYEVVSWDECLYPDGSSWNAMSVGKGVLKNWYVNVYRDGT